MLVVLQRADGVQNNFVVENVPDGMRIRHGIDWGPKISPNVDGLWRNLFPFAAAGAQLDGCLDSGEPMVIDNLKEPPDS